MSSSFNVITASPLVATSVAVDLKPREHGAYAILLIPLATAILNIILSGSGISIVGLLVLVASLAGFFAHEPLLVALGHRGGKAQRDASGARGRTIGLLLLGSIAGVAAVALASTLVRLGLLACLIAAIVSLALAAARLHRTLGGQLFGVVGLSLPCVPILLAAEVPWQPTLLVWLAWLMGFVSTTLAVRGVIAAQKGQPRTTHWLVLSIVTASAGMFMLLGKWLPLAALPMVLASWILMLWPPPAKHLRRVGWTLVAVTSLTAGLLLIATQLV